MANNSSGNMIVGLDIGTSKVVAIVGEINAEGGLNIVGIGRHRSRGLRKGAVVNIESTVQSIQRAVEEAELMAGCRIHSVYACDRCGAGGCDSCGPEDSAHLAAGIHY